MIITISGSVGSGKDDVAGIIAKRLNYKIYSVGNLRREIAAKEGKTIDQFNKEGEQGRDTDKLVDDATAELGKTENNFILVGRLGYFLIPHSFRVFLDVDDYVGAQRVLNAKRASEPYKTPEEAAEGIRQRNESDAKRYKKFYGIKDHLSKSNFDICINTTDLTQEEVAAKILECTGQHHSKTI
jgi:predicted cytidylate kinase